jgi:hypothetical protein
MSFRPLARLAAVSLSIAGILACGDNPAPLGPSSGPKLEVVNPPVKAPVVKRLAPLADYEWTSVWLYPKVAPKTKGKGKQTVTSTTDVTVKLRLSGLVVEFPAGAVNDPVQVWVVAYPGDEVAYEFYPHGLKFNMPIKIQQDLHGTGAYMNETIMSDMQGGYMPNGMADIDSTTGEATFTEIFPVVYAQGDTVYEKLTPSIAKFYTTHFSGYALASGRKRDVLTDSTATPPANQ